MKPFVYLSALALGIQLAQAQENQFEIIVDAVHVRNSETALPITLMNESEVRAEASISIGDTLSSQPGINNASFGPAVGQPVIRGQQGRRVMSLTNGMPNADASGNSADHATAVEPMLATGIEVLRGPSTLLYGGGAIGGVVNVIDNRFADRVPAAPAFSVELRHGTAADMTTLVGSSSFPLGNAVLHLDMTQRGWNDQEIPGLAIHPDYLDDPDEIENSNGFIANSLGQTQAGTAALSYILDQGFIGLSYNRMESEYGLPPGVHGHHDEEGEAGEEAENVSIDLTRNRYDFISELNNLRPWLETLNYRFSYTDYGHAEVEGNGAIGTRFSNESVQHRLQLTHVDFGNWHGVLGIQHSDETFSADGEESFIPVTDIRGSGIFLVEALHQNSITYEFGMRLNYDKLSPETAGITSKSFNTHSYSASALWDVSGAVTLGAAYSHSERAPSVEELYSNTGLNNPDDCVVHFATGSCELGDTDLTTEASDNLDLSLFLGLSSLEATFTVFYNSFEDYIYQANSGLEVDGFPIRNYRNEDAVFYGVEVDATYFISADWEMRIFADSISGDLDISGDVPRLPPYRVGSELSFTGGALSTTLSFLHAFEQDKSGLNENITDAYSKWDFDVNYLVDTRASGELLLFSKVRNITDEEIRLSTSFLRGYAPESGRSFELGVRYSF